MTNESLNYVNCKKMEIDLTNPITDRRKDEEKILNGKESFKNNLSYLLRNIKNDGESKNRKIPKTLKI